MIISLNVSFLTYADEIPQTINTFTKTRGLPDTAEDFFGSGWKLISKPKTVRKQWEDISTANKVGKTVTLFFMGSLLKGYVSASIAATTVAELILNNDPDFESIGGIYTRTFYIAKPVNDELQNVNVPVACYVKSVTIVYNDSSMSINHYETSAEVYDVPNIQSIAWYKLTNIDNYWY